MNDDKLNIGDIVEVLFVDSQDRDSKVKVGDLFVVLENDTVPFCFRAGLDITNYCSENCVALINSQVRVLGHDYNEELYIKENYREIFNGNYDDDEIDWE